MLSATYSVGCTHQLTYILIFLIFLLLGLIKVDFLLESTLSFKFVYIHIDLKFIISPFYLEMILNPNLNALYCSSDIYF